MTRAKLIDAIYKIKITVAIPYCYVFLLWLWLWPGGVEVSRGRQDDRASGRPPIGSSSSLGDASILGVAEESAGILADVLVRSS